MRAPRLDWERHMPPLSEADHQVRSTGIGSSDISAIVGENPFKTVHEVWLEKSGLVERQGETDATWLGHELEPIVGKRYTMESGIGLRRGRGTARAKANPWQLCTIDFHFAREGRRIVETKWVGMRTMHHWNMEADGAPTYVQAQVQWQMGVLGYKQADVAVIFGGTAEFRIYQFAFDAEMFAFLTELGRKFWHDRVLAGVPPPADETEAARLVLNTIYRKHTKPLVDAPEGAADWYALRVDADARLDKAEADKTLATNKLCELIGEHEGIRGDGWYATWKEDCNGKRRFRAAEFKQKGRRAA